MYPPFVFKASVTHLSSISHLSVKNPSHAVCHTIIVVRSLPLPLHACDSPRHSFLECLSHIGHLSPVGHISHVGHPSQFSHTSHVGHPSQFSHTSHLTCRSSDTVKLHVTGRSHLTRRSSVTVKLQVKRRSHVTGRSNVNVRKKSINAATSGKSGLHSDINSTLFQTSEEKQVCTNHPPIDIARTPLATARQLP